MKKYNPFNMWLPYATAFSFLLIAIYVILNKGDLPSILATQTDNSGNLTFLGIIILIIAFPVSFFGLTIEGIVPNILYILITLTVEIIYGFLIGWAIHSIFRRLSNHKRFKN